MKSYFYTCTIIMGSLGIQDTERMKDALTGLMQHIDTADVEILKVLGEEPLDNYYYSADVRYTHHNLLSVLRFSEVLKPFCLFHGMHLQEHYLSLQ